MHLDAAFPQPPCQPEPIPPCLKGEGDPVNWPARLLRLRSPALDQSNQCCWIRIELLQWAALKAGDHSGDEPAELAHLHDHKQRASLVKDSDRAAEVIDFGHGCGSDRLFKRRWCLTSPPTHSFYRGSGSASYPPATLLSVLIYGYATGVVSSRKLEPATYDSVAVRVIAAYDHPDHDTIATFRRRFLKEIEALFVEVLKLAGEMGVLKLGTEALDGTKIHANPSRHSARSYEHASKIETQLKAEGPELLAKAEAVDQADVPDGMSIPEELAHREARLEKLAAARAKIEARAKERFEREQVEYHAKLAAREAKADATCRKPRSKPPEPPVEGPLPRDQINLTHEESRIMPVAGGGFEQCYNAQAVVAVGSLLVGAPEGVQAANDKQQLQPMLNKLAVLPDALGDVETLLADSGYYSAANVTACAAAGIDPLDGRDRQPQHPSL